jgi:bifunctional UDP-N-acetylglucosamine pyrophosphorylase/glucosamine-1-phosphate N-acetyltransferase
MARGEVPADEADEAGGVVAVVLAAGLGKRMRSTLPKVLHPVGGRPMLLRVLTAARDAGVGRAVVVTGVHAARVEEAVRAEGEALRPLEVAFAHQDEPRGTGHAVQCALAQQPPAGAASLLVLPGDAPLLGPDVLGALLRRHRSSGAAATLLTAILPNPEGYGRILRDAAGRVVGIVEERDATPEQRRVREVNTLACCFRRDLLEEALALCRPTNAQGEIYLTDAVGLLAGRGERIEAVLAEDAEAVLGVNDRRALAAAEAALRRRVLERWMDAGVTVLDPQTTFVDERAVLGQDCVLHPFTVLEGACEIGPGCTLGPGAHLRDSRLGAGCVVWHSVVEGSELGPDCRVGPFAHLRPGCRLGRGVQVGNFAELKAAVLGDGCKQHHHSYVGDAELGPGVNVGAGVITANFDGRRKHRTVVGAGAFLGCNVNLIAPVEVGAGAFVAAGTTVSRPVPPDALAVGRPEVVVREGWAARRRQEGNRPSGPNEEGTPGHGPTPG